MTREEAIDKASVPGSIRDTTVLFVDRLVALGILILDPPPEAPHLTEIADELIKEGVGHLDKMSALILLRRIGRLGYKIVKA